MMTVAEYKKMIDDALEDEFKGCEKLPQAELFESMRYSLLAGGKRIRGILVLEFCRISGGDIKKALPVACGIEMMHTYSLIHDDLPCMDNDVLRRGKPTNHVVYGECTATIAGDALQAEAFVRILESELPAENRALCAEYLAEAVGADGMCGGQYLDMVAEGKELTLDELMDLNGRKTGALIIAACKMGVAAAGGTERMTDAAAIYGASIGQAFQIRDDMLDVLSSNEVLGKSVGSDKDENKNTFMALFGQERCQQTIDKLTEGAKMILGDAFEDTDFLCSLADSMASRIN